MRGALLFLALASACRAPLGPPQDGVGMRGESRRFAGALWDDGLAEVASYRVLARRYGVLRESHAMLIFVKETFDADALVKADGPEPERTLEVMKLNHVLTVPTGVYTYRLMASVFLTRRDARTLKLATSSQEWCGITHKRLVVRDARAELLTSSYFGAEGERSFDVPMDAQTVLYDALPMWLRTLDFSRPVRRVRIVSEQLDNRAPPPEVAPGRIAVGARASIDVPAGRFEVFPVRVQHSGGADVYYFGTEAPHVLVRWERSDGGRYDLEWTRRAAYWEMHDLDDVGALTR